MSAEANLLLARRENGQLKPHLHYRKNRQGKDKNRQR